MKHTTQKQHHVRVPLTASVRTRLTLWYLAVMAFIMVLFGGSLYATQTFKNVDTAKNELETQLYQDSQHFTPMYMYLEVIPGQIDHPYNGRLDTSS